MSIAKYRLLVLAPTPLVSEALSGLKSTDLTVTTVMSAQQALAQLSREATAFLLVDFEALGVEGTPLLRRVSRQSPLTDILLYATSPPSEVIADAVIDKQSNLGDLRQSISDAVAIRQLLNENGMYGHSRNLRDAARRIRQVAPTDISVLVTGPSGTGKELIARALHRSSPRAGREYVSINCASIPETLLESELFGYERGAFTGADRNQPGLLTRADKGTLFLDEIGEMHPRLQAKLLRAIDTKTFMPLGGRKNITVDVRIIAATNRDLHQEVEAGNFRADLYYRLSVITIEMQRLAERPEDILPIIAHSLGRLSSQIHFAPDAVELLLRYSWPGNVRELSNFLQRLLVTSPQGEVSRETVASLLDRYRLDDRSLPVVTNLTPEESGYRLMYQALMNLANEVVELKRLIHDRLDEIPAENISGTLTSPTTDGELEAMEEKLIRETLMKVGGNRKQAAAVLGIGERTLYRKLKRFGLS